MLVKYFLCCMCDDEQPDEKNGKMQKESEPKLLDKQSNKSNILSSNVEEKNQHVQAKQFLEIRITPVKLAQEQKILDLKQNKIVQDDNEDLNKTLTIKHQKITSQSIQATIKGRRKSKKNIKQTSLIYEPSQKPPKYRTLSSSKNSVEKKITINKKIDNSWYQQQSDDQNSKAFDASLKEEGLPNIGNTCYLNSIIQFLFAAQKFKSVIQKISENNQNSFHYRLTQVFRSIEQHEKLSKKKSYLKAIIKDLTQYQPQFEPYQQNDSLQCLLSILNMLQNEDSSSSKLNYFKLAYSLTCKCKDNQNLIHESLHISSRQKCPTCKEDFGIIIQSSPIYLILAPDREIKQYVSLSKMNGEKIIYQCKAFVSYFGNRAQGHYIAHRKISNKSWICLNDSHVSPNQDVKKLEYIPRYCLYQFKKKISNRPLQKI